MAAKRIIHKISRREAIFAHRMITQEGILVKDAAKMIGREGKLLVYTIRREVDPNFKARRGRRSKKSRFLTPEQYEYARKFFKGSGLRCQSAAKLLAGKYDWSWHIMYYMLTETKDYESAMKYAKEFNFTELWNRENFRWRKRFGEQ